jgi:hypothetical protein
LRRKESHSVSDVTRTAANKHSLSYFWTGFTLRICSCEHENTFTPLLGANIAQIGPQTSTTGVEFMDSALNALIGALTSIRDQAGIGAQRGRIRETRKIPFLEVQRLRPT